MPPAFSSSTGIASGRIWCFPGTVPRAGPDLGKLTIAVKGMTALQIDVRTAATDLHSGGYGAAVPNAAQVVAHLAGSFHDSDGRVLVEGFYDDVVDLE